MNRLLRIFFILLLLFLAFGISLLIIQPRIPLHGLNSSVSSLLSSLTGKSIRVGGKYFITPGIWTVLEVEDSDFFIQAEAGDSSVKIATAATRIHLFSLFQKELAVKGFSLHGLASDIHLEAGEEDNEAAEFSRNLSTVFSVEITGALDVSDLKVEITDKESGPPLQLQIDTARGYITDTYQGQLDLDGSVAGEPISVRLTSDTKQNRTEDEAVAAFTVDLAYKSITGVIRGELSHLSNNPVLVCDADFSGKRIRDVLSLAGISSSNDSPFSISTQLWLTEEDSKILLTELRPGSTDLTASFTVSNYRREQPGYHLSLQAEEVDLDLLQSWFDKTETGDTEKVQDDSAGKNPTLSLIPDHLSFFMKLAKLKVMNQTVREVELNVTADNSGIIRSPFTARFENADIKGSFSIDNRHEVPLFSAQLQSQAWDIGTSLISHGLAKGLGFMVDQLRIDVTSRGQSLSELGSNLLFEATAGKGLFTATDPATGRELKVVLDTTAIVGGAGKKLQYDVEGTINDIPISVAATIDPERDSLSNALSAARVNHLVTIGTTRWELEGSIPLPFSLDNFSLTSNLEGTSLSELNTLLHIELPHTLPYRGSAIITGVSGGYQLTDLHLTTGESSVSGGVSFSGREEPPRLSASLVSQQIQLDDFKTMSLAEDKPKNNRGDNASEKEGRKRLHDQDIVESYNAEIELEVKEVFSGNDRLGEGLLKLTQKDGNLYLAPLRLSLPQGNIHITFIRKPVSGGYNYLLNTRVDDLDYGIIARHLDPQSESSGKVSLRSSLYSDSSDFDNLLTNATGYIDFSLEPEKLRAGVIDLWAVNLLSYLTPLLVPKNESRINCVAGRFDIVHGKLSERAFLIDTSKIQVSGTVNVDFGKGWIDAHLKPRPKRPQFYSLATPININGHLSDFKAGVDASSIIATTFRLATSYVVVPFQWLSQKRVPADDREKCLQIIRDRGNLIEERPWDAD